MTKRGTILRIASGLVALLLATPTFAQAEKSISVVATFSILGDMVKRIGGTHVAVTTLVGPNGDAHVYQPTPADARAVKSAKVLFVNGLAFEGWIDRLVAASGFGGTRVVATDGIKAIPFEEGDDHGNGHGDHAFEWAGVFDLAAGTYKWSFAKVDGNYADPTMKMAILESGDIEASEEKAEQLLEASSSDAKRHGDVLVAQNKAYSLNFDTTKDMTVFSVEIKKAGKYAFYTEHMPFEFEADEHFFKDHARKDVEPIAQEPETGHHGHGHGDHVKHGNDDHKRDDHGHEKKHAHEDSHKDHGQDREKHGHDDHKKDAHGHQGHDHGAFDPHAWQDLKNAVIYVDNITAALAKADPVNAAAFYENREAYLAEIETLDAKIRAMLAKLSENKRTVVTSHDAFGYFAAAYGLRFEAPQGMSTESEASAADVAKLTRQIREQGISAVFVETITDNRLLEQIARETGATIGGTLYSDALSDTDGPASTYLDMMRHNANTLTMSLGS